MNNASGEAGETPEYLTLPTHAGLCGRTSRFLTARGTKRESNFEFFKDVIEKMEGSQNETSRASIEAASIK